MVSQMCFLGMGNMGKAMSRNLATKAKLNKPVLIWSRTTANAMAHAEDVPNVQMVQTVNEAVQKCDIIWSCLSNDDAVVSTFDTILRTEDVSGKLFVECSTVSTGTTRDVAARVLQRGAEFVAMPVFGEPSMAAAGTLVLVPAGKPQSVDKIRPYLIGVLGQGVIDYSGEAVERSSLLKLVGNVFIMLMMEALAEGHVLAEKCGLGVSNLEKFVETVFPAPYMLHSKNMTTGRYHQGSPVANVSMVKHIVDNVSELAESCGTKLPAYEVVRKNLDLIENKVGPTGDVDGLYGVVRQLSGLSYRN